MIAAWVLLAAALAPLQGPLQERAADESHTFQARGADSTRAADLLERRFSKRGAAVAVIVYRDTPPGRIYADAGAICQRVPDIQLVTVANAPGCGELPDPLGPQVQPPAISRDGRVVLTTVTTTDNATESVARDVATIRSIIPANAYITGDAGFDADRSAAVEGIDGRLLAITSVLVVVLLLFVYRSPLLALVPLFVVSVAYLVASGLICALVATGVTTISGQSAAILIVLMFGAGTDYCVLVVSRRDRPGAARPAILSSGAIVAAAMLTLGLADFNATREMAPVLAIGVAVTVAASLTLLPALLGRSRPPERGPGLWVKVGGIVRAEPTLTAVACALLLTAGALGVLSPRGTLTFTEAFRTAPDSVAGAQEIQRAFAPGRVAPLDVIVPTELAPRAQDALIGTPEVDTVIADAKSDDGRLIALQAYLTLDPLDRPAIDAIPKLRQIAGPGVLIGGVTAEAYDSAHALTADARIIVPLITLVVFAILVVLLRALVAPLYAIATVLLSFAFAMGTSSLIFTHVLGQPDSDPTRATFTFIFLVALGVDYNIFLIARIREESADMPARDAVVRGLERTGRVITSAGLILAGTFAALMALELEALFQVGFTVALGLLVDTFVVRSFLVPSIAYLLAERNWWPSRAGRG